MSTVPISAPAGPAAAHGAPRPPRTAFVLPLWDRLPTAAYWILPVLVAAPVIARSVARHRRPHPAPPGQGHTPR